MDREGGVGLVGFEGVDDFVFLRFLRGLIIKVIGVEKGFYGVCLEGLFFWSLFFFVVVIGVRF